MDVSIRRMQGDEYAVFADMERQCYGDDAWTEDELKSSPDIDLHILRVGGTVAGGVIFHVNHGLTRRRKASLYVIATTVLPRFRKQGLGLILKAWQLSYARANGFKRVCGHIRASNKASIKMNEKFGIVMSEPFAGYYDEEDAVTYDHKV